MTSQSQVLKGQQREVKRRQLKSSEGVLVTVLSGHEKMRGDFSELTWQCQMDLELL